MRVIFGKTEDEILRRLAFVYYATSKRGPRETVVANEIVEQLDMISMKIGGLVDYHKLMEYVDDYRTNGCTEFIEKYGTYWSKEAKNVDI